MDKKKIVVQITYPDRGIRRFECKDYDSSMGTIMLYDSDFYNDDWFYAVKDWSECEVIKDGSVDG